MISKKGYFKQELTHDGRQIEHEDPWDPSNFMKLLPDMIKVPIQSRDVLVRAWLYNATSQTRGVIPVYACVNSPFF